MSLRPDIRGAGDWRARGFWPGLTVSGCLDRWARERPHKVAIRDGAGAYTYQELARAVDRVALGLRAHGVGPGGSVCCQLPNWNEFVIVALATERVGAVITPIPPIYRARELTFMLGLLESQVLVVPGTFRGFDHVAMAAGLRAAAPKLEHVFVARGEPGEGMQPLAALTETAWEARARGVDLPGVDPDEVHEVIFTSGTTGEPKGVTHTPNTAISIIPPAVERLGLTGDDVVLMSSTLGHQTGYLYGYCMPFLLGATTVWLDIWNPEVAARIIERERVSFTMGATPFLQDLTGTAALASSDVSSLRVFISAGAPIPRPLVREARSRLGCVISAGWGMTENGLVTCNGLDDPEEKVFGTDGFPLRGMELRVVDDAGQVIPPGTEGHLLVRGPSMFAGYWKRPAYTAEAYTADGWFRTGDRARLDEAGYVSIMGRTKDLIIRGGENISAVEIENLLFTHPKIASVAVVGMPDPRLQERVCACVVLEPGQRLTLPEVVAYLETMQVARQKYPERIEVLEAFPMTPSGKVQKYRLREMVAAKLR